MKRRSIKNVISLYFEDVYSCTRCWSAWSWGTMAVDDFFPLSEDDELLDEIVLKLLNYDIKNLTYENFEEIFDGYTLYYNQNIFDNFENIHFSEDFLDHVNLDYLISELAS